MAMLPRWGDAQWGIARWPTELESLKERVLVLEQEVAHHSMLLGLSRTMQSLDAAASVKMH
jgi:hypothetical protein